MSRASRSIFEGLYRREKLHEISIFRNTGDDDKTYPLTPFRETPPRADQAVCVQASINDCPLNNVSANDGCIHRIWVFSPSGLGHCFPRMTTIIEHEEI